MQHKTHSMETTDVRQFTSISQITNLYLFQVIFNVSLIFLKTDNQFCELLLIRDWYSSGVLAT